MIIDTLAAELKAKPLQIQAAITLLDEGATVPFIARYRKEATQGLDDIQLRNLQQRLTYLRELQDRKQVILKSISEQEKLTDNLEKQIRSCESKTELEDIYLPFKPKRRTKGQIAIEAGLQPLADTLFRDPNQDPETIAATYINPDNSINDVKAALDGAKYILMERFAEDAILLQKVRRHLLSVAHIKSTIVSGKESEAAKYADYFNHSESIKNAPSHRALAMFRGRNEGLLTVSLMADPEHEDNKQRSYCEQIISGHINIQDKGRAADRWLSGVVQWTWKVKISLKMETELFSDLREKAEQEAISVFAKNLTDLLMAAPAGPKVTLGLDPGLRTGVKIAVVDQTGKVLTTSTIFPHAPQNQWDKSKRTLANICQQYKVNLVSIGNGTGSRETDKLVAEMIKENKELTLDKIVVSEAGASVYSASELASQELPELDVSLRGAVSIARRLQDPLAELVKIEPKAIGVGQYQHDVNQSQLAQSLSDVIEDCVNAVGVDVNMASPALLTYVSGLNRTLAQKIVELRDKQGAFKNRKDLKQVERLGAKAFEQCAGFLRIANGENPLDASAVHPEAYPLVEQMLSKIDSSVHELIDNKDKLRDIKADEFVSDMFGLPTINDVLSELDKPGRDPRPEFKMARFKEGVDSISDLKPGMILEGVVSNVANFGAFVDVGVHQDGLVHISALTNKFVSDPREVVKAGDIVKVKVLEVDVQRKRIAFTMRLDDNPTKTSNTRPNNKPQGNKGSSRPKSKSAQSGGLGGNSAMGNAFSDAFAKAKAKKK